MAWFGGGLSKLTDEISNLGNLTREVLSDTLSNQNEEVSEVAEDALQRRPSDVPELEEKVKHQEDVIQTLKMENDLLMKKLNDQLLSLDQASPRDVFKHVEKEDDEDFELDKIATIIKILLNSLYYFNCRKNSGKFGQTLKSHLPIASNRFIVDETLGKKISESFYKKR
ncbi:hypothetical protein WDU94_008561 [Cyamophila willieti]